MSSNSENKLSKSWNDSKMFHAWSRVQNKTKQNKETKQNKNPTKAKRREQQF